MHLLWENRTEQQQQQTVVSTLTKSLFLVRETDKASKYKP